MPCLQSLFGRALPASFRHSAADSASASAARSGRWQLRPRSAQTVVMGLALWLVVTANVALLGRVGHFSGTSWAPWQVRAVFALLAFFALLILLAPTAWPRGMKPIWVGMAVLAAMAQHFMVGYGTLMDKGMVHNILQTDWHESRDLLNPWLLAQVAFIAGIPALWLSRQPIQGHGGWMNVGRTVGLLVLAAGLLLGTVLGSYRQMAPLVRSNLEIRYLVNPLSPVLAALEVALQPLLKRPRPFASIAAEAQLLPAAGAEQRPPLLVLVVGETARADHFSLLAYGRDTNPELARRGVLALRQVTACGTATRESVPCMFSHLGRDDFVRSRVNYDNLLDVLQAAGLAVLWVDNQSGCQGVCERVPHVDAKDGVATPVLKAFCSDDGECLDGLLTATLDQRLASLPPERARNGVVLVLHQMGGHGPAYYKRSDTARKAFMPECATNALAECSQQQLVNVYDNAIRYTDHMLAGVIDWLKAQPHYATGMVYVADHGESLGENGMYLHGMPWSLAPEAQKHVPWLMWLGGGLGQRSDIDGGCATAQADRPFTHDNYFHTVLGLLGVSSPTRVPALDMLGNCRHVAHLVSAPVLETGAKGG